MILLRYYRDFIIVAFYVFLYPILVSEYLIHNLPEHHRLAGIIWAGLGVLGILGNFFKLRSLDESVKEKNLQGKVQFGFWRFLSATVAQPIFPVFGLSLYFFEPKWIGLIYTGFAIFCAVTIVAYGFGKHPQASGPVSRVLGDIGLILFELSMYTLFLEIFFLEEPNFKITLKQVFLIFFPMSALFVLLFLPATFGFFLEEFIQKRSSKRAFFSLYARFVFFRFIPVFYGFYRGLHLGS